MTLPTSGPLSLADIAGEFGGGEPYSLSNYYAGGAYVPSGTTGTYGAVPSSGAISIQNFYGTSKFVPVTHTYTSGSGTETVPTGAKSLTVIVVGAGAGGGAGYYNSGTGEYFGGGGGGSGGLSDVTVSIDSSDWGKTISYSVGAGVGGYPDVGGSSTTTGSVSGGSVSLSATGGTGGESGTGSGGDGSGGPGGSPGGNAGTNGDASRAGAGGAAPNGDGQGAGGIGGLTGGPGNGINGEVIFKWS